MVAQITFPENQTWTVLHRTNYLPAIKIIILSSLFLIGFLSLENDDVSGNMGLLDQIMALTWVNRHISSFCGAKDRITIFGQSAGGAAVSLMLVSPMAKGKIMILCMLLLSTSAFDPKKKNHQRVVISAIDLSYF